MITEKARNCYFPQLSVEWLDLINWLYFMQNLFGDAIVVIIAIRFSTEASDVKLLYV